MKLAPFIPHSFNLSCRARRLQGELQLSFHWQDQFVLPAPHQQVGTRRQGLWEESCFEFFLRPLDQSGIYYEINLAPNGDWNSFVFTSYRSRPLTESEDLTCLRFALGTSELEATFALPPSLQGANLKANACAIMPHLPDRARFLAFAHSSRAPDFHDPSTFIYYL